MLTVGTVIELKEAAKNVLKFQQSRDFKCDKHGYVNMPVGKVSDTTMLVQDSLHS